MESDPVVFITGASSGVGLALARGLQERDYAVVASMRDVEGRNAAIADDLAHRGVVPIEVDVTDDGSVQRGVDEAIERLGSVDILVNNAGFGMLGPLECATVDDLKAQFETNVYGAHRMARACLPHMRSRSQGLILQISSGAGRFSLPGNGAYAASKWALEAMGEALRYELSPFGIDCVIVELGPYDTRFQTVSRRTVSDTERAPAYEQLSRAQERDRRARFLAGEKTAGDPDTLVDPIDSVIRTERGSRPTRLVLHPAEELLVRYNAMLSEIQTHMLKSRGYDEFLANGV